LTQNSFASISPQLRHLLILDRWAWNWFGCAEVLYLFSVIIVNTFIFEIETIACHH